MSAEENKKIVRQVIEEFNNGNFNAFFDALASDCEVVFWTGETMGKTAVGGFMEELVRAFPDVNLELEDLIAEGDKVVTRFTERGTMTKSLMGMEPTEKEYAIPSIEIYDFKDGMITRMWAGVWMDSDLAAVVKSRLGQVCPPGQAA